MLLFQQAMKAFILALAVCGALFLWQHNAQQSAKPIVTASNAVGTPAKQAAAPVRPISEHDWAKHSIDRAHEVADQVRANRQQNQQ
jgi:hypothetical protein